MTIDHPLVTAWLERVERLAADLSPGARSELLADLREHVDAALSEDADGAQVGAVLERLGDPADIVTAARADGPDPVWPVPPPGTPAATAPDAPDRLLTPEVAALAVLTLTGLTGVLALLAGPLFSILTILLWVIGIALVAVSGRWRGGEVLAMVLLPALWALPPLSMFVSVGSSLTSCVSDMSTGVETCTTEQSGIRGPWAILATVVLLVLVVLATRWLARAPRERSVRR